VILEIDEKFQQEAGAELLKEARNSKGIGARGLLERAIRLDPENAAAHNELSWFLTTGLAGLRDPTAALTHARRAVELEASKHEYLNTLGVALYRTGQLGEAIAVLQRAWELSPPEQEAYDLVFLALCHAAEADWPAANDYFARATRAVESQHSSLPPGTRDELNRFLNEARAAGLPR
jgi:Tfp pilus assembly protein PilF